MDFLHLLHDILFCSRAPSRTPHYILVVCFLGLLLAMTVSQIPLCFWLILTVWGAPVGYNVLHWDFSDVFLIISLCLWVLGLKTTKEKCHSHHTSSRVHTIDMTDHCCCWPWSLGCVGQFLQVTLPSPFPHCILWKEITMHSPYLRGLPPWEKGSP